MDMLVHIFCQQSFQLNTQVNNNHNNVHFVAIFQEVLGDARNFALWKTHDSLYMWNLEITEKQ